MSFVDAKRNKGLTFDGTNEAVNLGDSLDSIFYGAVKKFTISGLD